MGIRFYCPQGHKLNVKSFLAGKKGFCPHCNAKVDIPLRSTRPSSKEDKQKSVQSALVVPVGGPAGSAGPPAGDAPLARPIAAPSHGAPMALPVQPAGGPAAAAAGQAATMAPPTLAPANNPGATNGPAASPIFPHSQAPAAAATPPSTSAVAPQTPAPTSPAKVDPIAEAPHAVWYVRPSLGGQYGPASGDMLRQWIEQGRVAADSLVWREGWPHWQPAGTVLPQTVASTSSGLPDATNMGLPMSLDPLPAAARNSLGRSTHRKRSNVMVTLIVVLLLIIALALAGVLIAMLG